MFFTGNAKKPQANWFFQRDSSICLRLFALDNEITHLPQAIGCRLSDSSISLRLYLVLRIEEIYLLKLWGLDELILLSAWGFFLYPVLKGYMFWSDEASTTWFFCQLKAFLYHVLKGYISWSGESSTNWFFRPPKAFLALRIGGVRIRRGMGVRGRRCAATWDWRWQNEKRSRMRLSSGSLRFSRRHRGVLCAV